MSVRGSFFDAAYEGTPAWDIGRPQSEFVRLARQRRRLAPEAGEIVGDVLDVGCGTGENALYLASRGHEVWGIDIVEAAIEKAQAKAKERGLKATFQVWNVLELDRLGRTFDTVIDSGLFHALSLSDIPRFVAGLKAVLRPGGTYLMLCFSEHEPGGWGPRRVTQAEIRSAFANGWRINYIREARFDTLHGPDGARAWLASITRV